MEGVQIKCSSSGKKVGKFWLCGHSKRGNEEDEDWLVILEIHKGMRRGAL